MNGFLSRIPLLLILFPFIGGIILSYCDCNPVIAYASLGCSVLVSALLLALKHKVAIITLRPVYQLAIALFCLFLGWLDTNISKPRDINQSTTQHKMAYACVEQITDNDFTMSLRLTVLAASDSLFRFHDIQQFPATALIDCNDYSLSEGDIIVFPYHFDKINSNGNPESFDYAYYMYNKGVLFSTFLHRKSYLKLNELSVKYLPIKSRMIQRKLINLVNKAQLSPDTKNFINTALIGDASFIDKDKRQILSNAGIAHILALSGLHVGIILLILSVLLHPLDYMGFKRTKLVLCIFFIIAYVFITGLPYSAVRAAIMAIFVIIAHLLYRRNSSVNALFAAGTVILLWTPLALFDVGFQLSFATVLCILLLSNKLNPISIKRKRLHKITSMICVSLAAFVGSVSLTAYYFGSVSLLSLVSNLLIYPFLPFFFVVAIIHLIFLSFGVDISITAKILEYCYNYIMSVGNTISDLPYSHLNDIYLSSTALLLSVSVIIAIGLFIYHKSFFYLCCSTLSLLGLTTFLTIERINTPSCGYIILNEYNQTPILIYENRKAYIWCVDDSIDIADFKQQHTRLLNKLMIDTIIQTSQTRTSYCYINNIYGVIADKSFTFINDNKCRQMKHQPKISVDYLIVTKRFSAKINDILNNYAPTTLVLSGDIHYNLLPRLVNECDSSQINYHAMKLKGSIDNENP